MIDVLISPPAHKTVTGRKIKKQERGGDKPVTSLLKSISWRIVGTIDTITISLIVTGEIKSALSIGSVEVVSKMLLYYFHERAWARAKKPAAKNSKIDKDAIISGIGSN